MQQQSEKLRTAGFTVSYVEKQSDVAPSFMSATNTHIFCSPEMLQHNIVPYLLSMSPEDRHRISSVFVDESHCIAKW